MNKNQTAAAPPENKKSTFALGHTSDPQEIVKQKIPAEILDRYEVHSYRNAATILSGSRTEEFHDLLSTLREFSITRCMIRTAGGNESEIPQLVSRLLRPRGWYETTIQGDLLVRLVWKEQDGVRANGAPRYAEVREEGLRERYLDGHKVDYVKGKVAFDLEWNSKDQTFDRDLFAFSAFYQTGAIDVAVLLTRSKLLNPVFRTLGNALNSDGTIARKRDGTPRLTHEKYGASTTWMGKLIPRLNAGRHGGCPVLAIGITPKCISD